MWPRILTRLGELPGKAIYVERLSPPDFILQITIDLWRLGRSRKLELRKALAVRHIRRAQNEQGLDDRFSHRAKL